jgi:putative restriction endonuclease
MNFFVAVTDYDWFQLHVSKSHVDEVNFWRPSPEASFKALSIGEILLFKLHSPRNFIVGGGFFTRFVQLLISLSWEPSSEELREEYNWSTHGTLPAQYRP